MEKNKLKIIFVGMPDLATICLSNLLKKDFNIVGVIPPVSSHCTYESFKDFVNYHNLNLIEFDKTPNEQSCIEKIKALNADIGVVCSYNILLSKEFLNSTKMGYINCHPSLLPNYRGAAPYFHIINNGETTSAVTLHFMDEKFDTGDIIYQEKFDVLPIETMGTLFNRTSFMLSDALAEILEKIQNGDKVNRIVQKKDEKFIEAPRVGGNFRLRWNTKTVFENERLIRACNPFYNVYTTFRNTNLRIIKASALKKEHNLEYGSIALASDKNFIVAGLGGFLELKIIQIGTWGIFDVADFYNMFQPSTDEKLI